MNLRGWTWIDEESITEEQIEKVTPLLDELARQWSVLHDAEEQRGFRRQADYEDGYRDDEEFEDEADKYARAQIEHIRMNLHQAQLSAIEDMLAAHGARMMRPYEHWNEDERYMQYQESRYDY